MVKTQQKAEIRIRCEAGAYHGFNRIEAEVVGKIGALECCCEELSGGLCADRQPAQWFGNYAEILN